MLPFQNEHEHNGQTKLLDLDGELVLFPQVRYTAVNKMNNKKKMLSFSALTSLI